MAKGVVKLVALDFSGAFMSCWILLTSHSCHCSGCSVDQVHLQGAGFF